MIGKDIISTNFVNSEYLGYKRAVCGKKVDTAA